MLKTLVLNEYWCVPDEANLLLCILEHSLVLEELTLELFSEVHMYSINGKLLYSIRTFTLLIDFEHLFLFTTGA